MVKSRREDSYIRVSWDMRRMLATLIAESGLKADDYYRSLGRDAERVMSLVRFKGVVKGSIIQVSHDEHALLKRIGEASGYRERPPTVAVDDSMRRQVASAMADFNLNTLGLGRLCEDAGLPDAHPLINRILAGGPLHIAQRDWQAITNALRDEHRGTVRPIAETLDL